MKFDYLEEKKELISVILSGISILFAVLICMKIISYIRISVRVRNIEDMVQAMIAQDSNSPDDLEKYLCSTKEMANDLKKSNLFAPPQPKKNPVTQVGMILGDEAWINNKWYKEGDMIQDAKVVAIEPTQVTIEWDGKTKVLSPLGAKTDSNGSSGKAPPGPENIPAFSSRVVTFAPPSQEQPPGDIPTPEVVINEPFSPEQIPDEIKNVMEQMNLPNISPEMLQNMSDEEKEQFKNMLRMQMQRSSEFDKIAR